MADVGPPVLFLEPWYGGSHRQLSESLHASGVPLSLATLPARHWKWRMRGSAVALAEHPTVVTASRQGPRPAIVLASSYLPLAEWVGLCPALADLPRVLYFHENQLAYPMRPEFSGERDLHYGFTQLVSALAATECWFNSAHNRDSFLEAGTRLLGAMPDAAPSDWIARIAARSHVTYLPLQLPAAAPTRPVSPEATSRTRGPLIVWNHRWEHDKNPEGFFAALETLVSEAVPFRVAVCGPRFTRAPPIFESARRWLGDRVEHFGSFADDDPAAYWDLLRRADVVVSTAVHEFFGVSVLEAVHAGARPWVPDRLAYVETIPAEYRWRNDDEFVAGLRAMCRGYVAGRDLREDRREIVDRFRAEAIVPTMVDRLRALVDAHSSSPTR